MTCDAVKLAFGQAPRFCPHLVPEQLIFMQEVAVLLLRLQQCDPPNCSSLSLDHYGSDTSRPVPTPTQWKDTLTVACRVSAAMLWATSAANQQPSEASLKRIFFLNQLLEDILYKSLYASVSSYKPDNASVLR